MKYGWEGPMWFFSEANDINGNCLFSTVMAFDTATLKNLPVVPCKYCDTPISLPPPYDWTISVDMKTGEYFHDSCQLRHEPEKYKVGENDLEL